MSDNNEDNNEDDDRLCLICECTTNNRVDGCNHRICWECMEKHCKVAIDDRIYKIQCPERRCDNYLPYNYVVRCLDSDSYVGRLDLLITNAALEDELQNENCVRCPRCRTICEIDRGTFRCVACATTFCAACNEEEHYDDNDCAFRQIEGIVGDYESKRCPKCRIFICKDDGCDCVRCPHCKRKFCWNCLMIYKKMDSKESHQERCENFNAFNNDEQSDADSD